MKYTVNSECGLADIEADSLEDAKCDYARLYHFDFDVAEYPGSWYWVALNGEKIDEAGL
jgi:hypothetical protein